MKAEVRRQESEGEGRETGDRRRKEKTEVRRQNSEKAVHTPVTLVK